MHTHRHACTHVHAHTWVMWAGHLTMLKPGRIFTAKKINSGVVIKTQNPTPSTSSFLKQKEGEKMRETQI